MSTQPDVDIQASLLAALCLTLASLGVPAVSAGTPASYEDTARQEQIEHFVGPDSARATEASPLAAALRNRMEAAGSRPERLVVRRERVQTAATVSAFYEGRSYEPAWVTLSGLTPDARQLLDVLATSDADGLQPNDYHVSVLDSQVGRLDADSPSDPDVGRLVDVELLLTDGFLLYGSHLLMGRVDAESLDPRWRAERRERDMVELLDMAVRKGIPRDVLHGLRPPQIEYVQLMEALAAYRKMVTDDGWSAVPPGAMLVPGDRSDRVPALRSRLSGVPAVVVAGEDLTDFEAAADSLVYDTRLAEAVRAFQDRHGLEPDAVVGPATLAALNTGPVERVRQLELNLERWRWLPQDLGAQHVMVNTADFQLDAIRGGRTEFTMRAIVGRPYRQTPMFSDRITYIVFRPYWHVPHSLAVQDHLPLQKADPSYFRRLGFRLFRGWGGDVNEVDPASVDWSDVTARTFNYRLRQDPGPQNFLGAAKFMFPNPYNVYLHDTPGREQFQRNVRNFSSGCIRLENPRALAVWLLEGNRAWPPERIDRAMRADTEVAVSLAEPVPVHLLYWTAFVRDGVVHFRPDIYDRDGRLAAALTEPPSGVQPREGIPS